jgi:hypothetical protein
MSSLDDAPLMRRKAMLRESYDFSLQHDLTLGTRQSRAYGQKSLPRKPYGSVCGADLCAP